MSNWISGCRIKKYLEPLTQEMLAQIHNAKKLEQEKQRVIKEARDEAQVRILRRKQQQEGRLTRIPLRQITCTPTTAPEEMTREVQHATQELPVDINMITETPQAKELVRHILNEIERQEQGYDDMYMSPFIYIGFRNIAIRSYALLDTGARCNVISHELVDQIPDIARIEETKCF